MILLRACLLAGLIAHKVLWEVMKRRQPGATVSESAPSTSVRLAKLVKLAILLGILAQTLVPDVLPILENAFLLRLVGTLVYTLGLGLAMIARVQLGENWSDIEEGRVQQEHAVKSNGVYRYIKHPIYVGDLLLLVGLELALNSWLVLGVLLMAPFVLAQAIREERKLVRSLPGYADYASRTKRFIPFVV